MTSKCLLVNMMAVYFSLIDVYVPSGKGWRRVHGYRADMQIYNSHITGLCGIGREDKVYRMLDAIYQKSMRLS